MPATTTLNVTGPPSQTSWLAGCCVIEGAVSTVNVTVETVSPDFDFDGDVDLEDFGQFQICLSGNTPQNDPDCFKARLDDGDLDVDKGDLAIFLKCLSGANVLAEPTCDDF